MTAIMAQGISMLLGFVMSFVVPKFMGIEVFSYWQLFIFYTLYVGFFSFGLNDGVYLRYGGVDLDKMDKQAVGGQFQIQLCFLLLLASITYIIVLWGAIDGYRKLVWCFLPFYMVVFNMGNYSGYILQAANKVNSYSYSILISKVFILIGLIVLFSLNVSSFAPYVILSTLGTIISSFFCIWWIRNLLFKKIKSFPFVIAEMKESVKVGLKVMFSAIASMLIVGIGRFFIDLEWGVIIFGKVSLAMAFATFILGFIQQVSIVFFPILKRIEKESQIRVYNLLCSFCFFLMPLVYICVVPAKLFIEHWLPDYVESAVILGVLMPICIFDAKMNMVFNTFLKSLRLEKELLRINILACSFSLMGCLLSVYIFHSYWMVILVMPIAVAFRSFMAERTTGRKLHSDNIGEFIWEVCLSAFFIVMYLKCSVPALTMGLLMAAYIIQLFVFREKFKIITRSLKSFLFAPKH